MLLCLKKYYIYITFFSFQVRVHLNQKPPSPINLSPHTHTHTHKYKHKHKPSNLRQSHTHTIKPVGANNGRHTHHPNHRSANSRRRFETQAVENTQKNSDVQPRKTSKIPKNTQATDLKPRSPI